MSQKLDYPFYPWEQPAWNNRGNAPWGWLTQGYTGLGKHEGRDYGVAQGTPYHGSGDGVVVDKQIGWVGGGGGGWGTHYVIEYPDTLIHDGNVYTIYVRTAHMSDAPLNIGDRVSRGQIIGASGNTGTSSGPHLHLETRTGFVRNQRRGDLIDPEKVFFWPNQTNDNQPTTPTTPTPPPEPVLTPEQIEENELMSAKDDIINAINAAKEETVSQTVEALKKDAADNDDMWMGRDERDNTVWIVLFGFATYVEPVYTDDTKTTIDDKATGDRIQDLIRMGFDYRDDQGATLADLPKTGLKFG